MQGLKFTQSVRASYESYYAIDLLEGCDCANRSDVFVNIFVEVEPAQVLEYPDSPFHICELNPVTFRSRISYLSLSGFVTVFHISHRRRSSVSFGGETFLPEDICMKN